MALNGNLICFTCAQTNITHILIAMYDAVTCKLDLCLPILISSRFFAPSRCHPFNLVYFFVFLVDFSRFYVDMQ